MNTILARLSTIPLEQIDPRVTANGDAPWMPAMRDIAGMVLTTCIILVVVILVIGIALAAAGKLGSMQAAQSTGWMIIVWSLVAAAGMGSASGLVFWATSIKLAPTAAAALQTLIG
jgi:hypothetical protein